MSFAAYSRAILVAASVAFVAPAAAQPADPPAAAVQPIGEALTGEARTKYDIGRILYRDGDYRGALANFRRAYDLSKEPRLRDS